MVRKLCVLREDEGTDCPNRGFSRMAQISRVFRLQRGKSGLISLYFQALLFRFVRFLFQLCQTFVEFLLLPLQA